MAFQGSLAELHLPDIIQLVSVSGKTGVFHLVDGHLKGQIYLHEGRIVHATLDEVSGEEAVYALAIWNQGDFKFEPAPAERGPDDLEEQHQPAHGGGAAPGRVARPLQEDPVRRADPGVRRAREPGGTDQPQHQRVADPLQDRRPPQREGDRPGQRPQRVRRRQDPLRPDRDRPHPPSRARAAPAPAAARPPPPSRRPALMPRGRRRAPSRPCRRSRLRRRRARPRPRPRRRRS